jgi:hypothetical protein
MRKPSAFLLPPWRLGSKIMNASEDELEFMIGSAVLTGWLFAGLLVFGLFAELEIAFFNPPYGSPLERWGTVFCDFLVVIGVGGEVLMAAMADHGQDELTRRAKLELVEAKQDLEQLAFESGAMEVDLERATNGLADAQRKLAHAIERAAKAELETERIKKEVSWRKLDAPTATKLVAELSKTPSRATLVFISGDPEATEYCAQLFNAFRRANWTIEVVGRTFMGSPIGIFVTHGDTWNDAIQAEIDRLRGAFNAAGISTSRGGVGGEVEGTKFRVATNDLRVIVGHRPPPFIE